MIFFLRDEVLNEPRLSDVGADNADHPLAPEHFLAVNRDGQPVLSRWNALRNLHMSFHQEGQLRGERRHLDPGGARVNPEGLG